MCLNNPSGQIRSGSWQEWISDLQWLHCSDKRSMFHNATDQCFQECFRTPTVWQKQSRVAVDRSYCRNNPSPCGAPLRYSPSLRSANPLSTTTTVALLLAFGKAPNDTSVSTRLCKHRKPDSVWSHVTSPSHGSPPQFDRLIWCNAITSNCQGADPRAKSLSPWRCSSDHARKLRGLFRTVAQSQPWTR